MDAPRHTRKRARELRATMTRPEVVLWLQLKGRRLDGLQFRRQHPLGPYVLDFYCHAARLAVEVDSESHAMGDRPQRDARRDAWLLAQGVRTVRLGASTVLEDADVAVTMIRNAVAEGPLSRSATAPPEGEH